MKQTTPDSDIRKDPAIAVVAASMSFDMDSGEIFRARDFLRDFLRRVRTVGGRPVTVDAAEIARLVVSELATNVCKHAPGPCRLDLRVQADVLTVTMRDYGWSGTPVVHRPDPDRVGQHGLEIVSALSRRMDVRQEPGGTRVRVEIPLA
ncbi:ATP-binding protein [Streptomyces sp. NPDC087440]|uniref:ATP-binding protein n=1 Tax=Streptomyces sp. NPDC087440 TaxID=3365790 RepID=UPI00380C8248